MIQSPLVNGHCITGNTAIGLYYRGSAFEVRNTWAHPQIEVG